MSNGHVSFVNGLAGAIANADLPDMGPAIKAIDEMMEPPAAAESPDFERLDEVVNAVEEARARRAQREAEKQSKELAAEAAAEATARTPRRKPKHRFVPPNPSTEPGPEGPEMEL